MDVCNRNHNRDRCVEYLRHSERLRTTSVPEHGEKSVHSPWMVMLVIMMGALELLSVA